MNRPRKFNKRKPKPIYADDNLTDLQNKNPKWHKVVED